MGWPVKPIGFIKYKNILKILHGFILLESNKKSNEAELNWIICLSKGIIKKNKKPLPSINDFDRNSPKWKNIFLK